MPAAETCGVGSNPDSAWLQVINILSVCTFLLSRSREVSSFLSSLHRQTKYFTIEIWHKECCEGLEPKSQFFCILHRAWWLKPIFPGFQKCHLVRGKWSNYWVAWSRDIPIPHSVAPAATTRSIRLQRAGIPPVMISTKYHLPPDQTIDFFVYAWKM